MTDILKALQSALETIEWMNGCTSPAQDEIDKAILEAKKAIAEHKSVWAAPPKTIVGYCHAIRELAARNASSPCAPTITEAECVETTLLYVLSVYNRKPSRSFNAELRRIQIAHNKKG